MRIMRTFVLIVLVVLLASCGNNPVLPNSTLASITLPTGDLTLKSADEGIFPDKSVLEDPENPFILTPITDQMKWEDQGGLEGSTVVAGGRSKACFYMWATILTREPWGEPQYYTALALKRQFEDNGSTILSNQAVRAYKSVLENFLWDMTVDEWGNLQRIALWAASDVTDIGINVADWGYLYDSSNNILEKNQ